MPSGTAFVDQAELPEGCTDRTLSEISQLVVLSSMYRAKHGNQLFLILFFSEKVDETSTSRGKFETLVQSAQTMELGFLLQP